MENLQFSTFGTTLSSLEQCEALDQLVIVTSNLSRDSRRRLRDMQKTIKSHRKKMKRFTAECELEVLQSFLGLATRSLPRTAQGLSNLKQQLVSLLNQKIDQRYSFVVRKLKSLVGLCPNKKAAIVVNSMTPEFITALFQELDKGHAEELLLELTHLPKISEETRKSVLQEFFGENYKAYLYDATPFTGFARRLRDWSVEQPIASQPQNDLLELPQTVPFSPSEKAAILFMTLPPELSAALFSEMGVEMVQMITLEITQLPAIMPEERMAVVLEFLGTEESVPDFTERLENFVKSSPVRAAELLQRLWV